MDVLNEKEFPDWFIYLYESGLRGRPSGDAKSIKRRMGIIASQLNEFDLDQAQLMEVAKLAVKQLDWWPTVHQLRRYSMEISGRSGIDEHKVAGWIKRYKHYKQLLEELREEWAQRPICPKCGEHTPNIVNCPFCKDLARMQAERESAGDLSDEEYKVLAAERIAAWRQTAGEVVS